MGTRIETAATTIIMIAAITIAAAVARREFQPSGRQTFAVPENPTVPVNNWDELKASGHLIGGPDAAVTIVEFSDFECPFCRRFSAAIADAKRNHGSALSVVFLHYPIPTHRFARPAARVAECAAAVNQFPAMHDLLFAKQDSLGLKSWASFANEAGIADTVSFARCAADTTRLKAVETGRRLGASVGVRGTPTVIINGLRYGSPPYDSLNEIVARLRAQK